jgi:predicted DNA-binding transcriptional regulator AlpA
MKAYTTLDSVENNHAHHPDAQNTKNTTNDPYLTKPQVARLFGVTTRTIDDWMKRRLLPYFKIRHTVRFAAQDIAACMTANFQMTSQTV